MSDAFYGAVGPPSTDEAFNRLTKFLFADTLQFQLNRAGKAIVKYIMLNSVIHNPEMVKYLVSYETGETLFFEGDDSQDIYVLASGTLDILKGTKKIAEIVKEGVVFGEMSFLLGQKRTATVKAMTDVKAIRIPKENVEPFLKEFPEVVTVVAKYLAKRLDDTSQTLFGFRELCDQLPDAVMIVDKEGKISTWNSAAEKLYGRDEGEMRGNSAEKIYEDPSVYKNASGRAEGRGCHSGKSTENQASGKRDMFRLHQHQGSV